VSARPHEGTRKAEVFEAAVSWVADRHGSAATVEAFDQYKSGGKGAERQFWLSAWSNRPVSVDRA
jgi:hypothetical protein